MLNDLQIQLSDYRNSGQIPPIASTIKTRVQTGLATVNFRADIRKGRGK